MLCRRSMGQNQTHDREQAPSTTERDGILARTDKKKSEVSLSFLVT